MVIFENIEFKLHPDFERYAVSKEGSVLNIVRKSIIKPLGGKIMIRPENGLSKRVLVDKLVWECFKGPLPKGRKIIHINRDPNDWSLGNLKIHTGERKPRLTPEERHANDKACKNRWKERLWTCPKCSKQMKNNYRGHHKLFCSFTDEAVRQEEILKRRERDAEWRNKKFNCSICGNEYKNSYKRIHSLICKKKNMPASIGM